MVTSVHICSIPCSSQQLLLKNSFSFFAENYWQLALQRLPHRWKWSCWVFYKSRIQGMRKDKTTPTLSFRRMSVSSFWWCVCRSSHYTIHVSCPEVPIMDQQWQVLGLSPVWSGPRIVDGPQLGGLCLFHWSAFYSLTTGDYMFCWVSFVFSAILGCVWWRIIVVLSLKFLDWVPTNHHLRTIVRLSVRLSVWYSNSS